MIEFNEIRLPDAIEEDAPTVDSPNLDQYRDAQSGLVGVDITIRPYEDDPSSVFGDPTYYFQKKLFIQSGLDVEK